MRGPNRAQFRFRQAGEHHRMKIRDGRDGQLLPTVQVARGADVFQAVAVLGQYRVIETEPVHPAGQAGID